MRHPFLLLVAVTALLSGCMDSQPKAVTSSTQAPERPDLEGWVFDDGKAALEGATLRLDAANATRTTAPDGYYSFDGLPTDVPLIITAEAEGYKPLSKSVTLLPETSLLLNFTLELVPVKVPRQTMTPYQGLLACQAFVVATEVEHRLDCGGDDPNNKPLIEFTMEPDVAGVVIELAWDAATPAADHLELTVDAVGFGDQDETLATAVGKSVLRAQINSFQALKYYSQGGIARATVAAGTNPDEDESTAGASVPLQQPFTLYVSVFYVEGPSPTYTALDDGAT